MGSSECLRRTFPVWPAWLAIVLGLHLSTGFAADGAYDPDFAVGGRRLLSLNDNDHMLAGMQQRANRKIVLAGRCHVDNGSGALISTFCAAEVSASGAPTDFGINPGANGPGRLLLTDFRPQAANEYLAAWGATLDALGRLLIVGQRYVTTGEAALVRVAVDGRSVEPLQVRTNAPDESEAIYFDVWMDASQRILLAGRVVRSGVGIVGVVSRLLPNLQPDPSFGDMGTIYLQVPDHSTAPFRVRSDSQGRIVVLSNMTQAGTGTTFSRVDRFSPAGAVEPGFGFGGHADLGSGPGFGLYRASGLAVDSSDRILVLGHFLNASDGDLDLNLVRLRSTGAGDVSRTLELEDLVSVGADEGPGALLVQPDGRILIVGHCQRLGTNYRVFLTMRMLDDFNLDPSYGAGGVSVGTFEAAPSNGLDDVAVALALDPVGGLVVAGTGLGNGVGAAYELGVARIMNAAVAGDPLFADGYED